MAWTTGTATDYVDLLDKLRAYLVTQGWTTLAFTAGTIPGGGGSLFTQGPGAGAGKRVHVEIRTEANTGTSIYSWRLRGATGYIAGAGEGLNPGASPIPSYFNLWQNSITYWFFVNDRRFMVVAKMSTSYSTMHAGFFLPWATPNAYPFPLYIGGTYNIAAAYNVSNSAHRFFADPGGGLAQASAHVRLPNGVWIPALNNDSTGNNDDAHGLGRAAYAFTWPFSVGHGRATAHTYFHIGVPQIGQSSGGVLDNIVATRQNEYGIFPIMICPSSEPPLGVFDGAFCVPGQGLVAEQAIATGGRNFTLFQNIARSSGNDFIALERI
jgi:hypothetical protein